uniref:Potassium voltage-gated channel subfamily D member 1-like n=1 Tax=Saccoglossus kowalevskii TaxID=10224 RepID=A0ABM0GJP3_SACKO|nr:PREDICTED: potassium voltage-gated channel subfamily D member 1-like [Saccoglossus kowalevskii]
MTTEQRISNDLINLNVGGKIYTTSRSTLTRYPDSMLGAMFGGDFPTRSDSNGNIVIDRDGELFRYVLNFLRNGNLRLPDSFREVELLEDEADFYQIKHFIHALRDWKLKKGGQKQDISEYVEVEDSHGVVRVTAPAKLWRSVPMLRNEVNKTQKYRMRVWDYHTALYHCSSTGNLPDVNDLGRLKLFKQLSFEGYDLLSMTSSRTDAVPGTDQVHRWMFRRNVEHRNIEVIAIDESALVLGQQPN